MSSKKILVLFLLLIAFSTTSPVLGCNSIILRSINRKNEATLTITDSFYTNLDNDDVLDIVTLFNLSFKGGYRHTVRIDVFLVLPSGYTFYYRWILGTKLSETSHKIRFYDHAIESGWYNLIIFARYFTGGMSTGIANYDFDPPGGAGGGDPIALM
ncbi:MAG: hypothetical protein ACFE8U_14675 [Candidatus Hermodarchaeota archaeon]